MEWLNYFIKKAFEKIDAENEKQAHLFLMQSIINGPGSNRSSLSILQVY